ncbi:hypothetical protein THAOC_05172, partial [Thalassiosira oceanica]
LLSRHGFVSSIQVAGAIPVPVKRPTWSAVADLQLSRPSAIQASAAEWRLAGDGVDFAAGVRAAVRWPTMRMRRTGSKGKDGGYQHGRRVPTRRQSSAAFSSRNWGGHHCSSSLLDYRLLCCAAGCLPAGLEEAGSITALPAYAYAWEHGQTGGPGHVPRARTGQPRGLASSRGSGFGWPSRHSHESVAG